MNDFTTQHDPQVPAEQTVRTAQLIDRPQLELDEPQTQETGSAFAPYVHALRRRWFMALSLGLIVGGAAVAAMWIVNKDQYTATVQFRVSSIEESVLPDNLRAASRTDFEIYKGTQQQYLQSDFVIKAALREPALQSLPFMQREEDPDRWLAEQTKSSFKGKGEIMDVSVTADTAQEAAFLSASVCKAYMDEVVFQARRQQKQRFTALQNTLTDKKGELDQKLGKLAEQLGSGDSDSLRTQQEVVQGQWSSICTRWFAKQEAITDLESQLKLLESQLSRAVDADGQPLATILDQQLVQAALDNDLGILELTEAAQAERDQMERIRALKRSQQQDKYETQHTSKLQEIENLIAKRRAKVEQDLVQRQLLFLTSEADRLRGELEIERDIEQRLAAKEKELRDQLRSVSGSSVNVDSLQREIDALERLIRPMDDEVQQLQIELNAPNRVTLITEVRDGNDEVIASEEEITVADLARSIRPNRPDRSSQLKKTAAAAFGMFMLTVGGILFLEVQAKRVSSPQDVSRRLGLTVIGAIPLIPARAISSGRGNGRYRRWRTLLNESMRGIMVRLLHEAQLERSTVVMVSSACSGEGKSTLAVNLSNALARAGYRTVLVDFDLRRPSLDTLFDVPAEPGVSEILRHEATLDEVVEALAIDNLSVIAAGRWSPHQVSVLANGSTESLFADLRKAFQFVIVDGAPILGVAESQLLCRHADTVLLSVLRDVSSAPKITAACETLANFGVRSLYAVVTGTVGRDQSYYYSDYGLDQD